jgi:hypothetical protein
MHTYLYKTISRCYVRIMIAAGTALLLSVQVQAQTTSGEGFSDPQSPKNGSGRESKWFVKVYGSYGLPLASSFRPGNANVTISGTPASPSNDYKLNRKGLGQGLRYGGGVGYILNENINLGLDVDQYRSEAITATASSSYIYLYERNVTDPKNALVDTSSSTSVSNSVYRSSMLTVTPNITFKAISRPGFYIYNRLGLCVGIINRLTSRETNEYSGYYYNSSTKTRSYYGRNGRRIETEEFGYKFEGGLSIGFLASLGVQVRITNSIRLFGEAQVISMTYSPKKRILTSQLSNGVDRLLEEKAVPMREREVEYVTSYSSTSKRPDPTQPEQRIRERFPYASIGLAAGVAYRF